MNPRAFLVLTAALGVPASAQTTLHELEGAAQDGLGQAVVDAGDVDGDGVGDVLVSATGETDFGTVHLVSGATGLFVYSVHCPVPTNQFGLELASLGDVDQDGVPDFAVGNPNGESGPSWAGSVRVFSGASGTELYALFGSFSPSQFGETIASVGDLDGDVAPDFLAGARADLSLGSNGTARLFSGASGALLHVITSRDLDQAWGTGIAGLGDVDGDLVPDFAVSSTGYIPPPGPDRHGRVRVFSGATYAVLYDVTGPEPKRHFGAAIESVPDVDGDGIRDFVVAAPGTGDFASDLRKAYLHSGADGALLRTFLGDFPNDRFGYPAALPDLDGDGTAEIAVSSSPEMYAKVYSGASGALLFRIRETKTHQFPALVVAGVDDLDGDGRGEIALGLPLDSTHGQFSGAVRILSDAMPPATGSISCSGDGSAGACPCGNSGASNEGCANSTGSGATLEGFGTTSVADDHFFLAATKLPPQTLVVLFSGTTSSPTAVSFAGAGLRCIRGSLRRVATRGANPAGEVWLGPGLQLAGAWSGGETRHFQLFYRNPVGPCGAVFNVSSAASVLFTP